MCVAAALPVDLHFGAHVNRLEHVYIAYVRRAFAIFARPPLKYDVNGFEILKL